MITPNNKKSQTAKGRGKKMLKNTSEAAMRMKTNENKTKCHQQKAKVKRN